MTREWEAAVKAGSLEELQRLFDSGSNINARDKYGQSALMIAAANGSESVVGWLIERGADLDYTAKYGLSSLMLAVIRDHADVVRRLVDAGADVQLRGTGSPGFSGKTALDLAIARDDAEMVEILRLTAENTATAVNRCFESARDWKAARLMLTFEPLQPKIKAGLPLRSLRVHVRDHELRELPIEDRTLEANYGAFVLSQSRRSAVEARRLALEVRYGAAPREIAIQGRAGRIYDLGPEPEPNDIDGRMPAVVVWQDGEMFCFLASSEMPAGQLLPIASSIYG